MGEGERGAGWKPALLLASRLVLFALWQGLIALALLALGETAPWGRAAGWWPYAATLTNGVSLGLLVWLLAREGKTLRDLYAFRRGTVVQDILAVLGITVISSALVLLPNYFVGQWLFGSAEAAAEILFQPLPMWAVLLGMVVFPISIALAELPTYFGYIMPRLEARTGSTWLSVGVAGFWLAAQHVTLPLIFDWRFVLWRLLMFLPFALLLAVVLRWRPRLLPYLMIVHGLLDLQTMIMLLQISRSG